MNHTLIHGNNVLSTITLYQVSKNANSGVPKAPR